ncbi:MAG: S-layer homology domain-containing protein [Tissierellia bacterium]|nr:S-layer homology domain-containing protein [Tissierellia bacterium]
MILSISKLINGYPDGTFRPDREITRAEMVVILNRLLGDRLNLDMLDNNRFTDIEDSWAKDEILKAIGK